ncbi:ABC transporter ATP-binding protein [Variovorax sp.]|jgi:branched-chain amino acid transport system ATP-binding protein|uniref:ABC transporter ATP-binding protein n=1 Tax=Variovorax sp. TaxID=1871043 RepID=UPI0037DA0BB6
MPLLEVRDLCSHYGDLQALFDLSLDVGEGEATALIGANGAGKSTLIRAIAGLGRRSRGTVRFDGQPIEAEPAERIARRGIALVPEGRMLFASLTVEENLRMGALCGRAGHWNLATVYALFPILREFRHRPATRLSGGQQQMVSIGRALMANPRLMLCDEISLGLAPVVIAQIYRAFGDIQAQGTALLVVEQDVTRACRIAQRVYCLLKGRVTLAGRASDFSAAQIANAYFGH